MTNVNFSPIIVNRRDQSNLVSGDVEDSLIVDRIRVGKHLPKMSQIVKIIPLNQPIPMLQGSERIWMFRGKVVKLD